MIQWCWTGEHGALEMRRPEREAAATEPAQADPGAERVFANVAFVVGADDNVGAAIVDMLRGSGTPSGPWKVYEFFVTKPGSASTSTSDGYVAMFLPESAHPGTTREVLTNLTTVTHVFYAAWFPRPGSTDADAHDANRAMLRRILSVVVSNCPGLVHVGLLSGRDQFVDPYDPVTGTASAMRPCFSEDLPRLEYPDLEDVLRTELPGIVANENGAARFTWSVHRPATVFGFSLGRASRNVVASLCVYAAICRKEGATLRWPGSQDAWDAFSEASDADLVAEHTLWAALELTGKNEVFNCTNGDVFQWKLLWPVLAKHFEVEWSGYEEEDRRFKLEDAMAGKEALWAEIVSEKGLVKTELADITAWPFVDAVINAGGAQQVDNMNKSKERGFFGFRDTVRSFDARIGKLKAGRIVP
jgi:hypothetical protein